MNEGMTDRNCCCQESVVVVRFPEYHPPGSSISSRSAFLARLCSLARSRDLPPMVNATCPLSKSTAQCAVNFREIGQDAELGGAL